MSSNSRREAVSGARKTEARVAAAPTVAYAGASATVSAAAATDDVIASDGIGEGAEESAALGQATYAAFGQTGAWHDGGATGGHDHQPLRAQIFVRRYTPDSRPWNPFHVDSAAVTVNVALSAGGGLSRAAEAPAALLAFALALGQALDPELRGHGEKGVEILLSNLDLAVSLEIGNGLMEGVRALAGGG